MDLKKQKKWDFSRSSQAEPDGSAEGKSFKLSPLGLGRFKPSHFSRFSYGSSMTPIDSVCCPDYRQYAQNMCAQLFVICETKTEKDGRSPPKKQRVRGPNFSSALHHSGFCSLCIWTDTNPPLPEASRKQFTENWTISFVTLKSDWFSI